MLNCSRSIHLFSAPTFTTSFFTPRKSAPSTKITPSTYRILLSESASVVATAKVPDLTTSYTYSAGDDLPENYGYDFPMPDPTRKRRAGVLLHPSSLPGPYGIGDFGEEAFKFLDWLHYSGCSIWQVLTKSLVAMSFLITIIALHYEFNKHIDGANRYLNADQVKSIINICLEVLPLVPPGRKSNEDGSPYSGQDANCGNTLLISLEELVRDGLLLKEELPEHIDMDQVHFATIADMKDPLVAKAAERLVQSHGELKMQLDNFRRDPKISCWLEDAALFSAIDHSIDTFSWTEWPEPLKNRHLDALEETYRVHEDYIDIFVAQQFLFQKQWLNIRNHARKLGIKIMGDMPIYVGHQSADVWANKKSFMLNRIGYPVLVSGVPPDCFSETGQLWGSPLYDWREMEENGYAWWIKRIKRALDLYDEFRIDHFRGLAGYWAVPSEEKVAMFGRWKAGPGKTFFDAVFQAVGKIDIIAEDLGVITKDVVQLREAIGAPGMAVLQFAYGGGYDNPHLPHNHEQNQVVYTGTHDNDTALGWWKKLKDDEKCKVQKYLSAGNETNISWALIDTALSSVARTAIIPMQDVLCLGSAARMNTPATQFGNWSWRIPKSTSFGSLEHEARKLKDLFSKYNRI